MNVDITDLKTVRLSQDGSAVIILDQTRLPGSEVYVSLSSAEEVWEAIYKLKVRGAPAIGIAAAYGIYVCSRLIVANTYDSFYSEFLRMKDYLGIFSPDCGQLGCRFGPDGKSCGCPFYEACSGNSGLVACRIGGDPGGRCGSLP